MATTARKGLGDLAQSIGDNLDDIENQPVTVTAISIDRRSLDSEMRDIAIIEIEGGKRYHTWSPYLVEKLTAISPDDLPAQGVFRRVDTRSGNRVWTVDNV